MGAKYNSALVVNSRAFFTAQVVDRFLRLDYDMTLILEDRGVDEPPHIVDFYYGEPNHDTTRDYIDRWLANGN